MLLSAPQALRDRLRPLSTKQVVDVAIRFRPRATTDSAELTKSALRSLARRYQTLSEEIDQLDVQLAELVTDITPPEMLERMGVGANVAASLLIAAGDKPQRLSKESSFAALCGSSPEDASSGKQKRHRLNRGGDRQTHAALWWIVFTRMTHDPSVTQGAVPVRTSETLDGSLVVGVRRPARVR
jgi:transposase